MAQFKQLLYEIALNELGETTEAYDYYFQGVKAGKAEWAFQSQSHTYEVKFMKSRKYFRTSFETSETNSSVTNEGDQFRVMATIMKIAKEMWDRRHELFEGVGGIEGFKYDAIPKPDEEFRDVTSRDKLYRQFVLKQFPNARIRTQNVYTLIIPEESYEAQEPTL